MTDEKRPSSTCRIEGCDEPALVPGACYDHCYACPSCGQPVRFLTDHEFIDCYPPED